MTKFTRKMRRLSKKLDEHRAQISDTNLLAIPDSAAERWIARWEHIEKEIVKCIRKHKPRIVRPRKSL